MARRTGCRRSWRAREATDALLRASARKRFAQLRGTSPRKRAFCMPATGRTVPSAQVRVGPSVRGAWSAGTAAGRRQSRRSAWLDPEHSNCLGSITRCGMRCRFQRLSSPGRWRRCGSTACNPSAVLPRGMLVRWLHTRKLGKAHSVSWTGGVAVFMSSPATRNTPLAGSSSTTHGNTRSRAAIWMRSAATRRS